MPQLTLHGQHLPHEAAPTFTPLNQRRILCVFPRYAPSFGTFEHAYQLMPGVGAFMPPQGLLVLAGYLPPTWPVRFVDENLGRVTEQDLQWADVVMISGMHVQRRHIERITHEARRHGKVTVLGGPSVSACPEYYPEVDILHVGEIGDATDELITRLDAGVEPPAQQIILRTTDRLPLEQFAPAYQLLDLRRYFLGSIQFSSGCPFLCEFCDIPALYGRQPRLKTPEQIVAELDTMLAAGLRGGVYFVDDNFIGNPAAARALLPHLIEWQRRTGYRLRFSCEATLNLAQMPDILAMMREAQFVACFVGIETPETNALDHIRKKQNLRQPILESIATLNAHGLEVVSGIIMGLDTDTPQTGDNILEFIEASQIPMLTINLLYALPQTRLHDRLQREGRLIDDPDRVSNVDFKLPYDQVLAMWLRVIRKAYEPEALIGRYQTQTQVAFPNRFTPPSRKVDRAELLFGLGVVSRTLWQSGIRADYRRHFRQAVLPLLRRGRIEDAVHIGIVTHHLIRYSRECIAGGGEASFYHDPNRSPAPANTTRPTPTSAHA